MLAHSEGRHKKSLPPVPRQQAMFAISKLRFLSFRTGAFFPVGGISFGTGCNPLREDPPAAFGMTPNDYFSSAKYLMVRTIWLV